MAEPQPQVVHAEDVEPELHERLPPRVPGRVETRVLIDSRAGSRHLIQRELRVRGDSELVRTFGEVLYLTSGPLRVGRWSPPVSREPGTIPPIGPTVSAGTALLDNRAWADPLGTMNMQEEAVLVSVVPMAPPDDLPESDVDLVAELTAHAIEPEHVVIHEDNQEPLPAGDDRYFKLLIESSHFTQFVGFIDRSRAPFHTHTYEEAIYIVSGEGVIHIEGLPEQPIRPGTSIFLPPGTPHCLENRSDGVLKLLGVFSPPGSPANRMEQT